MKIDAVIPWVDGSDPAHADKLRRYGSPSALGSADIGGATRFASLGEIAWCVASLNRFAPFLNRIYIITDGQDPHLDPFLDRYFPDGSRIPVEIVDHRVIFRGYEEYLPVFNSRAIETMMWRIPGLSEHFILLNDDFLLSAPVTEEDFFAPDGSVLCYAYKFNTRWARLLRALKPRHDGRKNVSFKESMLNAAEIVGEGSTFLRLEHTPRPLLRSWYEDFYAARPEVMLRNISHRFRSSSQFNAEEIQYLPLYREGRCRLVDPRRVLFFLQPKPKRDYVARKMARLASGSYKFCCFNSLDLASGEDRGIIISWITRTLGL